MSNYDSEFTSSDVQDTDEYVEVLDDLNTSDEKNDISEAIAETDIPITDEVDDGLYHAIKLSEEEINRIDDLWNQPQKRDTDIEPYKAVRISDLAQTNESTHPYKAIRLSDSSDLDDEFSAHDDVAGIDMPTSLEEQFAADIEAMSFDDLSAEQARLNSLSQMEDMDIFAEYDAFQKSNYDPELFKSLTDGLPRETLEYLRDGLASGNPDVYDYFGLNSDEDDESDTQSKLTRKL